LSESFKKLHLNWKTKEIVGQYQILQNSSEKLKICSSAQNSAEFPRKTVVVPTCQVHVETYKRIFTQTQTDRQTDRSLT